MCNLPVAIKKGGLFCSIPSAPPMYIRSEERRVGKECVP